MKIIHESNLIKEKAYGQSIEDFLQNNAKKIEVTLKSEIDKDTINDFLRMVNSLLDYNIFVFHNIHFQSENTNA